MDARVNDFLNEINEIAPLDDNKEENVWEKCYDEESGYYYYWNTQSNEVTWDMPPDYKAHNKSKNKKTTNLYVPPRTAPLFPSTSSLLPPVSDAIKIYKIGECTETVAGNNIKVGKSVKKENVSNPKEEKKKVPKPFARESDSDDEKIILISSYGGDSESEEEQVIEKKVISGSKKPLLTPNSEDEDEDDVDILTEMQSKASELKQKTDEPNTEKISIKPESKKISGFSLVAGYSDSEEEPETETPTKPNFLIAPPPPQESKVAHSTLFPITKPIDVKDFEETPKPVGENQNFDSKAFQRKRRIGVALINTGKKSKIDEDNERKGLGFSNDSNSGDNFSGSGGSTYPGFKSGGIMFVKADVLNPAPSSEPVGEKGQVVLREVEDTYTTLKEKLGFLCEGRDDILPVQAMLIQLETLYIALKSGDLKRNYLKKWLDEKCSELIKLEKETTPEGWLLQWDRTHKRYYYQNAATGESQWEYPQADVTVCDEAMDICTTPPPNGAEPTIHMSPPLPPIIGSPSPPPPPMISDCKKKKCDIPLPPEPKQATMVAERYDSNGEPLPPGVDVLDVATKTNKDSKNNDMSDVLNSFYNDIAAIETSNSPPIPNCEEQKCETSVDNTQESTKKKKKTKVKLTQGIAMKKKGVSKLVEKWKNVQLSYND